MRTILLGLLLLSAALALTCHKLMPTAPDPVIPTGLPAAPTAPVNAAGAGSVSSPTAPVNAAGAGSVSAPAVPSSIQAGGQPSAPTAPVNAAGSGSVSAPAAPVNAAGSGAVGAPGVPDAIQPESIPSAPAAPANTAGSGSVGAPSVPDVVTPLANEGKAKLIVDPDGDNNTMIVEALLAGTAGNDLSFTIMWDNSSGTWAWVENGNEIWVMIGAKSRLSLVDGYPYGTLGFRLYHDDYYCSNDVLINGKFYFERVGDPGVRVLYNGAKWVVSVDGVEYYEQQFPDFYYPGGPWLKTAAGFIAGNGNIGTSFLISSAQQVIDAINSTAETAALVVAVAVGDVTGGSWTFDATFLSGGLPGPSAPDSVQAGGFPASPTAPVNAAGSGSVAAPSVPDVIQTGGLPSAPTAPVNAAGAGTVSAPTAPVNAAGSGSVSAPTVPSSIQAGGQPSSPTAPVNAAGSGSVSSPAAPATVQATGLPSAPAAPSPVQP